MELSKTDLKAKLNQLMVDLKLSLSNDDAWQIEYDIENEFYTDALHYLFELIATKKPIIPSKHETLLTQFKQHLISIKKRENELLEVRLSDEEVISCAKTFMDKYEVFGKLDEGSVHYSTTYFDHENSPNWSIEAVLLPPTSESKRKVKFYITAFSQNVSLMASSSQSSTS